MKWLQPQQRRPARSRRFGTIPTASGTVGTGPLCVASARDSAQAARTERTPRWLHRIGSDARRSEAARAGEKLRARHGAMNARRSPGHHPGVIVVACAEMALARRRDRRYPSLFLSAVALLLAARGVDGSTAAPTGAPTARPTRVPTTATPTTPSSARACSDRIRR
jgi:hypothetical protein